MALPRVLEPEVMDTEEEAREYDAMDHAHVNSTFCADLLALSPPLASVLDVGTGTALIAIELCKRAPQARVLGIDLAASMLRTAARNVERAGLGGVIRLARADAKALPFADGAFSCVMSNTVLHHLAHPIIALAEMLRVLCPGGLLFVRDLARPDDEAAVSGLVSRYAGDASPLQQSLLASSLRAALTESELRAALHGMGIKQHAVRMTSDRHLSIAYAKSEATR